MNVHPTKIVKGIVFVSIIAVLLAAGNGRPESAPNSTPPPPSRTTPSPASASPLRGNEVALRAKGEEIYQRTAGGTGCQVCHGTDAKGSNLGPDIRGKTTEEIKGALSSDPMTYIYLTEKEIETVPTGRRE